MNRLYKYLQGGDLRSIAEVEKLRSLINSQKDFDELFDHLLSTDRLIVMRAADAIEKITVKYPEFLHSHKEELVHFLNNAEHKEFKWHLALLASRLVLRKKEQDMVWERLTGWVTDKKESKIVRVNALQSLYDISSKHSKYHKDLNSIIRKIETENIPSINARIRKIIE